MTKNQLRNFFGFGMCECDVCAHIFEFAILLDTNCMLCVRDLSVRRAALHLRCLFFKFSYGKLLGKQYSLG